MMDWLRDKVVLVTGGSAGLGEVLARTCAGRGAKVAICGRDRGRLERAAAALRAAGAEAEGFPADLLREDQAADLISRVGDRFQRLDLVVNNVGRSTRGLAAETTAAQFREMLEANFLTAVHVTRAALPMVTQSRGHLVFLGSLAAKVAAPYLGAYPASKFALAAYAHQLRLELAPQGIQVLLVCPGPIARSDGGRRYDARTEHLPESARRPGGGVRLDGIPPQLLAHRILDACQRGLPELVVPRKARWLFAVAQLWPTLGDWIIRRKTE